MSTVGVSSGVSPTVSKVQEKFGLLTGSQVKLKLGKHKTKNQKAVTVKQHERLLTENRFCFVCNSCGQITERFTYSNNCPSYCSICSKSRKR